MSESFDFHNTDCSIQTSHILTDLKTESMNGRKMKLQEIQELNDCI
jgi:hypothetical protein